MDILGIFLLPLLIIIAILLVLFFAVGIVYSFKECKLSGFVLSYI